jgi:hypothetical protein
MNFLQPWMLAGLPIALLPILIHLINLRRHRKVYWGAMMFLLAATQQRRGHTRLRHWLILAMRVLGLASLIFLVSRPLAGRWFSWFSGAPDTIVVVLDRSASMDQQDLQRGVSKRELALEQLATSLERTGMPRQLVLVESSGRPPQLLESPQALREQPDVGATDTTTNLPALLQSSLDYLVANQAGRTDIWVCSDLQAADWNADSGQWAAVRAGFQDLKSPTRFHLLTYPQPAPDNASVRVTRMQRERTGQQDRLLLDLEVRRAAGAADAKMPIEVVVDGARSVLEVTLQGEQTRVQNHIVPLDRQRPAGWGKVELPNDTNPRDNVFFFAYGEPLQHRTLIVSEQPGTTWALRLATAPRGSGTAPSNADASTSAAETSEANAQVVTPQDAAAADWSRLSLIVWQAPLPAEELAKRLESYVAGGGQVLFLPHDAADAESIFQTRWGTWEKLAEESGQPSIENWRDDRGPWMKTDAGDPLPVNTLVISDYRRIEGNGQVLARLRGGQPLLVQVPTDAGGVYFLGTLPQAPFSNLARQGIVYFAGMQRVLRDGTQRLLLEQFGVIGQAPTPASAARWQALEGWPEGRLSTQQPLVAGIYEDEARFVARNRPASEDTIGTVTRPQLDQLLAGLNFRLVEDSLEGGRGLITEIWRAFAIALLLALLAEGILCLPDAPANPGPAAHAGPLARSEVQA